MAREREIRIVNPIDRAAYNIGSIQTNHIRYRKTNE